MTILGIDIGGANTKLASDDGKIIELHYIPLWKNTKLPQILHDISKRLSPKKIGVVITGELADCFSDKESGISYIVDAVNNAFGDAWFFDSNGNFTKEKSQTLAAANWMASALVIGEDFGDCIFIDIGSSTTDIIPIKNGVPLAEKTDFLRLKKDELVYTGILRTNVAAVLKNLNLNGEKVRISSELFSITADVYRVLGIISEKEYTCDTPDSAGKSILDSKRRLARVVCADLNEIDDEIIISIAHQVMESQINDIVDAVSNFRGANKIVSCGLGEFLAQKVGEKLGLETIFVSLKYSKEISVVFPAYAVARLVGTSKKNS